MFEIGGPPQLFCWTSSQRVNKLKRYTWRENGLMIKSLSLCIIFYQTVNNSDSPLKQIVMNSNTKKELKPARNRSFFLVHLNQMVCQSRTAKNAAFSNLIMANTRKSSRGCVLPPCRSFCSPHSDSTNLNVSPSNWQLQELRLGPVEVCAGVRHHQTAQCIPGRGPQERRLPGNASP